MSKLRLPQPLIVVLVLAERVRARDWRVERGEEREHQQPAGAASVAEVGERYLELKEAFDALVEVRGRELDAKAAKIALLSALHILRDCAVVVLLGHHELVIDVDLELVRDLLQRRRRELVGGRVKLDEQRLFPARVAAEARKSAAGEGCTICVNVMCSLFGWLERGWTGVVR